jgi:hypothetical protein
MVIVCQPKRRDVHHGRRMSFMVGSSSSCLHGDRPSTEAPRHLGARQQSPPRLFSLKGEMSLMGRLFFVSSW